MNTLEIKGDWNSIKDHLKQKWSELTDDDLRYGEGQYDDLLGRMQERTGEDCQTVERAIRAACAESASK